MMTTIDWQAAGTDDPTAGRRTIRERLEAAGLAVNTADYNRAFEDFRRGQAAALAAQQADAEERERRRIEPHMAEARANVAGWGCVEDGESSPEEVEQWIVEEATRMADEAERAAAEAARAAEREAGEAGEYADYTSRQAGLRMAIAAAAAAVAVSDGWRIEERRCSHDSSRYFWLLRGGDPDAAGDYEEAVSLRISDHHAKNGSGWNEAKQEQYDAPDINIVLRRGAGGEYTFDLTPLVETLDR